MEEILTREESIQLAYELTGKYNDLSVKEAEFMDIKDKLDNLPDHSKDPKYSSFRFFWPYLIVAAVVEAVLSTMASLYVMTSSEASPVVCFVYGILILATWPTVMIYGGIKAKKRRDEYNEGVTMNARNSERIKLEYENKLQEKERELVILEEELEKYNDIVPPTMRTRDCMETVRRTIENGLAESFNEAIDRLKPIGHNKFY